MATEITEYCGRATRKGKGPPCRQRAGHGTGHPGAGACSKHGGSSPNAEVAGQVLLARRDALVMGVPLDIEPHEAILQCVKIAAGEVQFFSEQISRLQLETVMGPDVSTLTRPLSYGKEGESPTETVEEVRASTPKLHIWVEARHQAMDRLVQYSATAIKAGIEERHVKLAESQGQLLIQVIRGIVRELGVEDHPQLPQIVRRQLTLVAGQAA